MISNHAQFLDAITGRKLILLNFVSRSDGRLVDRVCAPLDYFAESAAPDATGIYLVWDYADNTQSNPLRLERNRIVHMRVLGENFDPVWFGLRSWRWHVPREWPAELASADGPEVPMDRMK